MTSDDVKALIEKSLPGSRVLVNDPMNDGQHFSALVVSETFVGLPLVKQHKAVLGPLREKFGNNTVHAIELKTMTPEQWEKLA